MEQLIIPVGFAILLLCWGVLLSSYIYRSIALKLRKKSDKKLWVDQAREEIGKYP